MIPVSCATTTYCRRYRKEFLQSGLLKALNTVVQFFPSLIVAQILKSVDKTKIGAAGSVTASASAAGWGWGWWQRALAAWPPLRLVYHEGILLTIALFLCLATKTITENQYFDMITRFSAEIRGALSTAIYSKSLRLSPSSRASNSAGEVINFMQIDAGRMEYVAGTVHTVWDGLLQIVGYTSLLLHFLGPSVLAGIATMMLIIPLNAYFLLKLSKLREENLKFTDNRVKLTNEILQGIRAIKSYNWEGPFSLKLQKIRDEELLCLKRSANTRAILVSTLSAAPSLVAVVTLATYTLLGNELSPTKVFTSLALFNQLRFPLIFFPMLMNTLAEGKVSLTRLSRFLLADEVDPYVRGSPGEALALDGVGDFGSQDAVAIKDGCFSWGGGSKPSTGAEAGTGAVANTEVEAEVEAASSAIATTVEGVSDCTNESASNELSGNKQAVKPQQQGRDRLVDVNMKVQKGELVAVVGATGSGKTTLLNALLGELNREGGAVMVQGKVVYVPQTSWIPNDSLRNVVLFGNAFDDDGTRYRSVLRACGLERDLELLEAGDQTEIGERGVNLSGGQKQRVSIARAVYEDADVYLLDDPLSALDAEVGGRVFSDCIKGTLADKTRVLVTHQLGLLPEVDRIIIMTPASGDGEASTILDQGTWLELLARGHDLSKFVAQKEKDGTLSATTTTTTTTNTSSNLTEEEKDDDDDDDDNDDDSHTAEDVPSFKVEMAEGQNDTEADAARDGNVFVSSGDTDIDCKETRRTIDSNPATEQSNPDTTPLVADVSEGADAGTGRDARTRSGREEKSNDTPERPKSLKSPECPESSQSSLRLSLVETAMSDVSLQQEYAGVVDACCEGAADREACLRLMRSSTSSASTSSSSGISASSDPESGETGEESGGAGRGVGVEEVRGRGGDGLGFDRYAEEKGVRIGKKRHEPGNAIDCDEIVGDDKAAASTAGVDTTSTASTTSTTSTTSTASTASTTSTTSTTNTAAAALSGLKSRSSRRAAGAGAGAGAGDAEHDGHAIKTDATQSSPVVTGDGRREGGGQNSGEEREDERGEEGGEEGGEEEGSKEGPQQLMTTEDRATGAVGRDVYRAYFRAANRPVLFVLVGLSFLAANFSQIAQQWVVAAWTSDVGYVRRPLGLYLGAVAGMAGMVGAASWMRTYLGVLVGAVASRNIHRQMVARVLGSPLSYFGEGKIVCTNACALKFNVKPLNMSGVFIVCIFTCIFIPPFALPSNAMMLCLPEEVTSSYLFASWLVSYENIFNTGYTCLCYCHP